MAHISIDCFEAQKHGRMHTQHDQVCGSSGWEHQNRLIIPILVPTCMMGNHIQRIQRQPASISQCPAWVERGKLTCTCSSSMLSTGSTKSIISLRETCQLNLHCTQRSEISRLGPTKKKGVLLSISAKTVAHLPAENHHYPIRRPTTGQAKIWPWDTSESAGILQISQLFST